MADESDLSRIDVIKAALQFYREWRSPQNTQVKALALAVELATAGVEQVTGKKWNEDGLTAAALVENLKQLILHFAPIDAATVTLPPNVPPGPGKPDIRGVAGKLITMIENEGLWPAENTVNRPGTRAALLRTLVTTKHAN
jgi:hypothetical protein